MFTFFDVETPNRGNRRICQIGVIRADERGSVDYRRSFFVDPETWFDDFCMSLHGITPQTVADAPTFDAVWLDELERVFAGSTLVAHNARFDIRVLSATLQHYGLNLAKCDYLCTVDMSRRYYPHLENHKLNTVAASLGIPLKHHDAMSDTEACYGIFRKTVEAYGTGVCMPRRQTQLSPPSPRRAQWVCMPRRPARRRPAWRKTRNGPA
jgi:DNA polymerase-3 subunit epsilon